MDLKWVRTFQHQESIAHLICVSEQLRDQLYTFVYLCTHFGLQLALTQGLKFSSQFSPSLIIKISFHHCYGVVTFSC